MWETNGDEDIPAIDATDTTTPPTLQGPMTRARARHIGPALLLPW